MLTHTSDIYHCIGSIMPTSTDGTTAREAFAQLYILDNGRQLEARMANAQNGGVRLDPGILEGLQRMMLDINPWVREFRAAAATDGPDVSLVIRPNRGELDDGRTLEMIPSPSSSTWDLPARLGRILHQHICMLPIDGAPTLFKGSEHLKSD